MHPVHPVSFFQKLFINKIPHQHSDQQILFYLLKALKFAYKLLGNCVHISKVRFFVHLVGVDIEKVCWFSFHIEDCSFLKCHVNTFPINGCL